MGWAYGNDRIAALSGYYVHIAANMYPHKLKTALFLITVPINLAVFPFMFPLAEGGGIRSGMPVWDGNGAFTAIYDCGWILVCPAGGCR